MLTARFLKRYVPIRILHGLLQAYLFFDRRERFAVSGYIFHGDLILLVRHAYGSKNWTFPGGFMEKGETPGEALKREAYEEVGLALEHLVLLKTVKDVRKHKNITVHRFYSEAVSKEFTIDEQEIKEAQWMSTGDALEHVGGDIFIREAIEYHRANR